MIKSPNKSLFPLATRWGRGQLIKKEKFVLLQANTTEKPAVPPPSPPTKAGSLGFYSHQTVRTCPKPPSPSCWGGRSGREGRGGSQDFYPHWVIMWLPPLQDQWRLCGEPGPLQAIVGNKTVPYHWRAVRRNCCFFWPERDQQSPGGELEFPPWPSSSKEPLPTLGAPGGLVGNLDFHPTPDSNKLPFSVVWMVSEKSAQTEDLNKIHSLIE